MKVKLIILITILICKAFCVDLFVEQNGNDTATCGSQQEPCATIQYAIDLFDTSNIIVNSNYTLDQPLQATNRNYIALNSTLGYNPTITFSNGFLLSSNSSLNFKGINIIASSFLISANQSSIYLNNANIGGSTFDRDLFSFNTGSSNSLSLENIVFLDDLQIGGSFVNGKNTTFVVFSSSTKNILINGAFPFININQGFVGLNSFIAQNIFLSQTPYIKLINDETATNQQILFSSYNLQNLHNASSIIETTNTDLEISNSNIASVQTTNALFSFQSTIKKSIKITNSGFQLSGSVPFESDLFSQSVTSIYIFDTTFTATGLAKDQALFGFDNASPVNITLTHISVSGLNGPALSLTNTSNTKPNNLLESNIHSLQISYNTFQNNQATQGAALNLISNTIPINLYSEQNVYLNNQATANGGSIYLRTSIENVNTYVSNFDRFTGNSAGGNGGSVYLENVQNVSVLLSSFVYNSAQNGGAVYAVNSPSLYNLTNIYNNTASVSGGSLYISNSDNNNLISLTIQNSTAQVSGGHIYLSAASVNIIRGNLYQGFAQNGGNVYIGKLSYLKYDNSFASGFNATNGGVFYVENGSTCYINRTTCFSGRASFGGIVYAETNSSVQIDYSNFQTTKVLYDGGAVWTQGKLNSFSTKYSFNDAERFGGCLFIQNTLSITLHLLELRSNSANKGAALYLSNSEIELSRITTTDYPFQSVFCNSSTVFVQNSTFSSFDCSKCNIEGTNTLCRTSSWVWIVVGVGSATLLVVIVLVSIYFYNKKKNQGYTSL